MAAHVQHLACRSSGICTFCIMTHDGVVGLRVFPLQDWERQLFAQFIEFYLQRIGSQIVEHKHHEHDDSKHHEHDDSKTRCNWSAPYQPTTSTPDKVLSSDPSTSSLTNLELSHLALYCAYCCLHVVGLENKEIWAWVQQGLRIAWGLDM